MEHGLLLVDREITDERQQLHLLTEHVLLVGFLLEIVIPENGRFPRADGGEVAGLDAVLSRPGRQSGEDLISLRKMTTHSRSSSLRAAMRGAGLSALMSAGAMNSD